MELKQIIEGEAGLMVPAAGLDAEVFFNPEMKFSRDITIACLKALNLSERDDFTYLDALAATGARGIRAALEVGLDVTLNDKNPLASELIKKNLELNNLNLRVENKDANVLMHEETFKLVDIDPFGSPVPFLDAAARSSKEYLFVTATDTAPLCGAHLASGIRKYDVSLKNIEFHREVGLRVLLGRVARDLRRRDKGMQVILAYGRRHYYRTHVKVIKGAIPADKVAEDLGFVVYCMSCGFRGLKEEEHDCPNCSSRTVRIGPLWVGKTSEPSIIASIAENFPYKNRIVETLEKELDIPYYYDHHRLCKGQCSPLPIEELIASLREIGFEASRTHLLGEGIKTNADIRILRDIVTK